MINNLKNNFLNAFSRPLNSVAFLQFHARKIGGSGNILKICISCRVLYAMLAYYACNLKLIISIVIIISLLIKNSLTNKSFNSSNEQKLPIYPFD